MRKRIINVLLWFLAVFISQIIAFYFTKEKFENFMEWFLNQINSLSIIILISLIVIIIIYEKFPKFDVLDIRTYKKKVDVNEFSEAELYLISLFIDDNNKIITLPLNNINRINAVKSMEYNNNLEYVGGGYPDPDIPPHSIRLNDNIFNYFNKNNKLLKKKLKNVDIKKYY